MAEERGSCSESSIYLTERLLKLIRAGAGIVSIQDLLLEGVDVNVRDSNGDSPLLLACSLRRKRIVHLLINSGASVEGCTDRKLTVLHFASTHGWLDIVKGLVKKMPDLNARDHRGETAIHDASRSGHLKIVKCLMKAGADVNLKNTKGLTPLICAAEASSKSIVDFLLNSASIGDDEGRLLYYASIYDWTDVVRTFVKRVPDLNKIYNPGFTALHVAARNGHLEVVQCLVKRGAGIYTSDAFGHSALHNASLEGQLEVVKWLVTKGPHMKRLFDLNTRNIRGETILHRAAEGGHVEVVRYLVEVGCDINAQNNEGATPLVVAARWNWKKVVVFLMWNGADISIPNWNKSTVLHYAAQHGWIDVLQSLANQGCDLNARNKFDVTALCCASAHHQLDAVRYLLQAGVYWDVVDVEGCSPLDFLTREEFIELFIEYVVYIKPVDYYLILKNYLPEALQDVKLCSQLIVSRYNYYDLPELYKLPVSERLPRMEKMQIACDSKVAQEIEQAVAIEIHTKGHCNILEVRLMPVSVLSVKSVLDYYEKKNNLNCKMS